jgi:outer membrane biosynthesis protein TonB
MRLIRWKRIGQSGRELAAAILFSFIIHGLLIAAALVYNLAASPKISVPISYQVMLVNAPTAVEPAQPQEAPLPPPKPEEAPAQKKTAPKAPAAAKPPTAAKSAMPDLGAPKAAQKKIQQPEATTEKEKPAAPSGLLPLRGPQIKRQ